MIDAGAIEHDHGDLRRWIYAKSLHCRPCDLLSANNYRILKFMQHERGKQSRSEGTPGAPAPKDKKVVKRPAPSSSIAKPLADAPLAYEQRGNDGDAVQAPEKKQRALSGWNAFQSEKLLRQRQRVGLGMQRRSARSGRP